MAVPATIARRCGTSTPRSQLNPSFYQAYSNRALIYRFTGDQAKALADYNHAIQINPNYDAAYIGRGDLYRKAGRTKDAFNDFQRAIQLDTTDGRAYHRRGLIYQAQGQHSFRDRGFLDGDLAVAGFARAIQWPRRLLSRAERRG